MCITAFGRDLNDAAEARRMLQSLRHTGRSLNDAITLAERHTGGKAFAAQLLNRRQVEQLYGDDDFSPVVPAESTSNGSEIQSNDDRVRDQAGIQSDGQTNPVAGNRAAPHVTVTCITDDVQFRHVVVDLASYRVVKIFTADSPPVERERAGSLPHPTGVLDDGRSDRRDAFDQRDGRDEYLARHAGGDDFDDDDRLRSRPDHDEGVRGSAADDDSGVGRLIRANQIISAKVNTDRGTELGRVDDLAIDRERNRVVYVAVQRDDDAHGRERRYAVPTDQVLPYANGRVHMDAGPEDFEGRDGFDNSRWPTQADAHWSPATTNQDCPTPAATHICRSMQLIGNRLFNRQDQNLGRVEDFVFDAETGTIAYLLVDAGRGMVPVPGPAADYADVDRVRIDMSEDEFAKQRRYARDDYPDWSDIQWHLSTYAAFGAEPYWEIEDSSEGMVFRSHDLPESPGDKQ